MKVNSKVGSDIKEETKKLSGMFGTKTLNSKCLNLFKYK